MIRIFFLLLLFPAQSYALEGRSNYAFLFVGAASVHHSSAAVGAEYLHVGTSALAFGARVDRALGSPGATYIAAPASLILGSSPHVTLNLRFFLAPGISIEPGETGFALEAGVGGMIPLGSSADWHLIPQLWADLAKRETPAFFGLQIGRKF